MKKGWFRVSANGFSSKLLYCILTDSTLCGYERHSNSPILYVQLVDNLKVQKSGDNLIISSEKEENIAIKLMDEVTCNDWLKYINETVQALKSKQRSLSQWISIEFIAYVFILNCIILLNESYFPTQKIQILLLLNGIFFTLVLGCVLIRKGKSSATSLKPSSTLSLDKGNSIKSSWSVEQKLRYLRENIVGRNIFIKTPNFWNANQEDFEKLNIGDFADHSKKLLLYEDFTASGRSLRFLDNYILECMNMYANTHTEMSATGSVTSQYFEQSIESVRNHVNAGKDSFVIPIGAGVTGAIEKLQKILGVYVAPKLKEVLSSESLLRMKKTVIFVSPYEHHSNDISWQENTICEFVRIKCTKDYILDFEDLEKRLQEFSEKKYRIIGSFSACSNVTGVLTDVKRVADLVHKYGGFAFVDYAASGPYVDINMERDNLDAIFLSPHKNLGGPGSCGLLIGKMRIYDTRCPPSFAGGGTVDFVTPWRIQFHSSIESRELAGTPPIRDVFQMSLSFMVKDWLGLDTIREIEDANCSEFMGMMLKHPRLRVLGNQDCSTRIPIISFVIRHGDRSLHQHFVTAILNDLFGIQSRSGCSCAGPFGHELLSINKERSNEFLEAICSNIVSMKPGWVRIGLHYTLTKEEMDYTKFAINGIAWFGHLFLFDYQMDMSTGGWIHVKPTEVSVSFTIEEAIHFDMNGETKTCPYIALSPDSEDARNAQLRKQEEDFISLVAFKSAGLLLPKGVSNKMKIDLYQLIRPVFSSFLKSLTPNIANFKTELFEVVNKFFGNNEETIHIQRLIETVIVCENNVNEDVFYNFADQKMLARIAFFYTVRGNIIYSDEMLPTTVESNDAHRRKGELLLFAFVFVTVKSQSVGVEVGYCLLKGTVNDPNINGYIEFTKMGKAVRMKVAVSGISVNPDSLHGIHMHQYGDLTSPNGLSAGDHWNPNNSVHGCPGNLTRHNGDTGNWQVRSGKISQTKTLDLLTLTGANSLIGHAVVIHAATDDCVTVPSSGIRLAYCVIGIANPGFYRKNKNNAVASPLPPFEERTAGICVLKPTRNNRVSGTIYIENTLNGTRVRAIVQGLSEKNNFYGFYIYEWGDIRDAAQGNSLGGHWNPYTQIHLGSNRHIGDLGNIKTTQGNSSVYEYTFNTFGLNGSLYNAIGRSIAITGNPDRCLGHSSISRENKLAQCVIGYANPTSTNYNFEPILYNQVCSQTS